MGRHLRPLLYSDLCICCCMKCLSRSRCASLISSRSLDSLFRRASSFAEAACCLALSASCHALSWAALAPPCPLQTTLRVPPQSAALTVANPQASRVTQPTLTLNLRNTKIAIERPLMNITSISQIFNNAPKQSVLLLIVEKYPLSICVVLKKDKLIISAHQIHSTPVYA